MTVFGFILAAFLPAVAAFTAPAAVAHGLRRVAASPAVDVQMVNLFGGSGATLRRCAVCSGTCALPQGH